MATSQVTVGYWGIRGRGGIIRNLLAYCGIPFTNKSYSDPNEWFGKDKQELGFEYPNLPYLIDGDKKLSESNAILRYIPIRAGKRELLGDSDDKFIQVETATNVVGDLRTAVGKLVWTKGDFKAEKEEAFTKGAVKAKLEILNKNLEGKEWLCGFLSIADFELFEVIDMISEMDGARLEAYPNLVSFLKRFLELPQVKAHRQTPEFIKLWSPPGMTAWTNA